MKLAAQPDCERTPLPLPLPGKAGMGRDIQMLSVNNLVSTAGTVRLSVCSMM